jgi:hypothetical protein
MSIAESLKITHKKLGLVCIATGTMVLGDPSHIEELDSAQMFPSGDLSKQIRKKLHCGACKHRKTIPSCVSLMTGIGDGFYEVEAEIVETAEEEVIKSIRVEFLSDDYVAELREHAAQRAIKERDRPRTLLVIGGEEKEIDDAITELVQTLEMTDGVTVVLWRSHHIDCGRVILEGPRAYDFVLAMAMLGNEQTGERYSVDLGDHYAMQWTKHTYPQILAAAKQVAAQMSGRPG